MSDSYRLTDLARVALCDAISCAVADSGMSDRQIELRVGLASGTVGRYCSGKREASPLIIAQMEAAMGIEPGSINTAASERLYSRLGVGLGLAS